MSKSYRKYPVVRQERIDKRLNNRVLRRRIKKLDYVLKGSLYKKLTIVDDWHYRWSKQDAIDKFNSAKYYGRYETLEEYLNFWASCTTRK